MATYKQIQAWVKANYGWEPKTCWIADCKEICGLDLGVAHNREGERKHPCPPHKKKAIFEVFEHFGMCRR